MFKIDCINAAASLDFASLPSTPNEPKNQQIAGGEGGSGTGTVSAEPSKQEQEKTVGTKAHEPVKHSMEKTATPSEVKSSESSEPSKKSGQSPKKNASRTAAPTKQAKAEIGKETSPSVVTQPKKKKETTAAAAPRSRPTSPPPEKNPEVEELKCKIKKTNDDFETLKVRLAMFISL